MKYTELKKEIKKAAELKKENITCYIATTGDDSRDSSGRLISNFIDCSTITDNQLIRATEEGLLDKDYDTYIVI